MPEYGVVSRDEWLEDRKEHLAKEKELTRLRDKLSRQQRELPWVIVDKNYLFDTPAGNESLADLFDGRTQLIIYHFMYGRDWAEGCPSCSFWADNFNGVDIHLNHRDISLVAVSTAPLDTLNAYKERMGWTFKWVSSNGNDFNHDYHVTFTPEEMRRDGVSYNYRVGKFPSEDGDIFHTYSCYARGLDMLNGAYHFIDLTPKGRDEDGLPFTMAWLRRRGQYED